MPSTIPATDLLAFTKLYATNSTSGSIVIPASTTTEPTAGSGVFDFRTARDRNATTNAMLLAFFGAGGDNSTGTARVTGWKKISSLWVPITLLKLDITLSTFVGVAASDVLNTERFADTLGHTGGTAVTSASEIVSLADNSPAYVKVDPCGCQYGQVDFALGTATALNGLWAGF